MFGWPAQLALLSGDGIPGLRDGAAAQARYADPYGLAIDARGTLYLADAGDNNRIRTISADGSVATLAGSGEGFKDGAAAEAMFNTPSGIALDATGNVFVADTGNHAIRKVSPQGAVTTLAGTGTPGYRDGAGAQAQFNAPLAVAVDAQGKVYVADTYNDRIRVIDTDGVVATLAGDGVAAYGDGSGTQASFDTPCAIAVAADGTIWVADTGNDALRTIAPNGKVGTFARAQAQDGKVMLRDPLSLALTRDGFVYVGARGRVLQFSPAGEMAVLTGASGSDDRLIRAAGLALDARGDLVVGDAASQRLYRIHPELAAAAAPPNPAPAAPIGPAADAPLPITGGRWPVRPQNQWHEIVGTVGEDRGAYNGDSRDHLHDGLDIRNNVGAPVLAIADAKVESPLSTWNFGEVGEGLGLDTLSYIHLRVGRNLDDKPLDPARFQMLRDATGQLERVRVPRGTRFAAGDVLGTTNAMAHVHLSVGPDGYHRNAIALGFAGFADHIAPHIESIQLQKTHGGALNRKQNGRVIVPRDAAGVAIIVDAWDQVDGNESRRRLGLYTLGWQILRGDGTPAAGFEQPRMTLVFDRIPADNAATKVAYAANSGITVYGSKATHFGYVVTNSVRDGHFAPDTWQTDQLPAGDYVVRIFASDYAGNSASKGRDLPISLKEPADIVPPQRARRAAK